MAVRIMQTRVMRARVTRVKGHGREDHANKGHESQGQESQGSRSSPVGLVKAGGQGWELTAGKPTNQAAQLVLSVPTMRLPRCGEAAGHAVIQLV
jgi:hypothetical protein